MNRIQFIGQTYSGALVSIDDIINFFDHTMAAYEVVQGVENASIHGTPDTIHSSLKIIVESPNQSELQDVVTYINDTIHNRKNLYGKSFSIQAHIDGTSVELFVQENYMM